MVLHDKDSVRDNLEDEVYASADLSVSMRNTGFQTESRIHAMPTALSMTN
jgi:hypothetical protein